jgi:heme-degrading monooxygenase HmoA
MDSVYMLGIPITTNDRTNKTRRSETTIMTIVHIGVYLAISAVIPPWLLAVLFKFRAEVTDEHKQKFVTELKKLKSLPCVKEQRLVVGGASITDPVERSKGFEFALLSFHEDRDALAEYQKSDEHHQ